MRSWIDQFSGLTSLDHTQRELLLQSSTVMDVSENTVVFGPGNTPDHLLLLLEGCVRVQQISEQGREIVLYRVRAGESCIMTAACMLALEHYSAQGITETPSRAVAIPVSTFEHLVGDSSAFRQFVFTAYSTRMVELFHVIEDVAFQRMDVRLADKLIELAQGQTSVRITHQQLAVELGTAREVISRQLSEFQRRHWVKLSRGSVDIEDELSLKNLAGT